MLRFSGSHRGCFDLSLCGGDSSRLTTHDEELEDELTDSDTGVSSSTVTPPRKKPLHLHETCESPPPLRVMSPSSSISTWSPDPLSPLGWNDDRSEGDFEDFKGISSPELDEDLPFIPSHFSPWMCVFDLDTACGAGAHSVDDRTTSYPSRRPTPELQQSPLLPAFPMDWNGLVPTVDFARWFGAGPKPVPLSNSVSAVNQSFRSCPDRIRPTPVYPSTIPTQYFTDFASEHPIEAIYVPVCALQQSDWIVSLLSVLQRLWKSLKALVSSQ